MLYENMTYEHLLNRMINKVLEKYPNLDSREGSIIFNALAPAALELAIAYTELDNAINESFAETASREYLLRHCEQMGMDISVFDASAGVHKGVFNVEVEIGSRWNCDLYNYEVIEYLGVEDEYHTYKLLCETEGTAPNNMVGDLTAISNIPYGLNYAVLTECLIEGENETPDETIKQEYYAYVKDIQTDGNVAQYGQWCREFPGIGNYKVFPLWNGANTVKVSILSASNEVIDTTEKGNLVETFQEYLDPGTTGMGDGKAPIGAFVTVSTAKKLPIGVYVEAKLAEGYTDTSVIEDAIKNYFTEISYKKDIVSYMSLGAAILKAEGVEFITNFFVNSNIVDILLGDEEIPFLVDCTVEVIE